MHHNDLSVSHQSWTKLKESQKYETINSIMKIVQTLAQKYPLRDYQDQYQVSGGRISQTWTFLDSLIDKYDV